MGGFLSTILRMLAPIAVEHGGQVLRDRYKSRLQAGREPEAIEVDRVQQVADDVSLLRGAVAELKSEMDLMVDDMAIRANRQRAWIIALVAWNAVITIALLVTVIILRRH
jgi:hypothetical protein